MATPVFRTFWLHVRTVGGGRDVAAIFIYSQVPRLKSQTLLGLPWNFSRDIRGPERMKLDNFDDRLTFPLALLCSALVFYYF